MQSPAESASQLRLIDLRYPTLAGGSIFNVLKLVLAPVIHLNQLTYPIGGPEAPRGRQENPCRQSHTQAPPSGWKTSHHHLKWLAFSFQLSSLPLSAISLSVFSCHPAHLSFPEAASSFFFFCFGLPPPPFFSVFHESPGWVRASHPTGCMGETLDISEQRPDRCRLIWPFL